MKRLKPFFSFYGSKYGLAPRYPAPEHGVVIEPFAGSAGYSLLYHTRQVRLYDADAIICGVWDYLIKAHPSDIYSLPDYIETVDDIKGPQEVKWLVGFWLERARWYPARTASRGWASRLRCSSDADCFWGYAAKDRIASQLGCVQHWKVSCREFWKCENDSATWFIDPPYDNHAGRKYKLQVCDYGKLADWCAGRNGLAIVCENEGAEWLPFRYLAQGNSSRGAYGKPKSVEAVCVMRNGDTLDFPPQSAKCSFGDDD